MKKQTNVKKVGAIALGAGIIAGTLLGALAYNPVMEVETIVYEDKIVEVPVEVVKEVPVEVIKEVEVVKTVTDTELIKATCDRLLFEDMGECQSEVLAEDKALKMALDYVESQDFFDELEDADLIDDEDDVKVIRVYDDFEDIVVLKSDFDDDKYRFEIEVKIEDLEEEEKKKVLANILVEDGEVEFKSVSEI